MSASTRLLDRSCKACSVAHVVLSKHCHSIAVFRETEGARALGEPSPTHHIDPETPRFDPLGSEPDDRPTPQQTQEIRRFPWSSRTRRQSDDPLSSGRRFKSPRPGTIALIPTFGFSFVGLAFLLALFIPNLLWWRFGIPQGYSTAGESRVLGIIERTGQVLVTGTALAFDNTNLRPWTPWSWWLVGAVALMAAYEVAWVRYFLSAHHARLLPSAARVAGAAGATAMCGVPAARRLRDAVAARGRIRRARGRAHRHPRAALAGVAGGVSRSRGQPFRPPAYLTRPPRPQGSGRGRPSRSAR